MNGKKDEEEIKDISEKWQTLKSLTYDTAGKVLGRPDGRRKKDWFRAKDREMLLEAGNYLGIRDRTERSLWKRESNFNTTLEYSKPIDGRKRQKTCSRLQ